MSINVIGAGLAGCEAAYAASKLGCKVNLIEMRPAKSTPAHKTSNFAELVCSNSLKAKQLTNASGLIKEEMRELGSLVMEAAEQSSVPAGGALAVDRKKFSGYITEKIKNDPNITVISKEATDYCLGEGDITVVATGPLTSEPLSEFIKGDIGEETLFFFDAAAPIVSADTIDMSKVYFASRYGKGEASYLNCPMRAEEYDAFYKALTGAQTAKLHSFDKENPQVYEGCMPVEVMARRGYDTLRFGPMKPVGLPDPKTGEEPFAVVQLRVENAAADMYNIVGFQTNLTFPEQKRVFGMIPGLENAEFLRYGVMHRNTFINSPKVLDADYSLRKDKRVFFAGQLTGVEGYLESASSGIVAGINAAMREKGRDSIIFPPETVIGALAAYISNPGTESFQPMNANYGVIKPLGYKVRGGKAKVHEEISFRAIGIMKDTAKDIFTQD